MQASILARIGLGFLFALVAATAVEARVIEIVINESKGVDATVDYAKLTAMGPWDDRNYALTAADLAVLSPHETDSHDPTPAFFRVWMRQDAVARGATVLTGGKAIDRDGTFFEPTVISGVVAGSDILREEMFVPVL